MWMREKAESGQRGGGPAIPDRLGGTPERGLHRFGQRGLRCRRTLHTPRLRGSGVERGGVDAQLDKYGIIMYQTAKLAVSPAAHFADRALETVELS